MPFTDASRSMVPRQSKVMGTHESARLQLLERDVLSHAKSLSELVVHIADIKTTTDALLIDKAVREEADRNLDARLRRIEESIERQTASFERKLGSIFKVGVWFCTVFGGAIIVAFVNFLLKGGLNP